ncbi:MAG: sigma-70 family RNA polymerase sigma factor, partial [Planctomycetaceae bacterium]
FCLRVEQYRRPMLHWINRHLSGSMRRRLDAEDVLQEVELHCPPSVQEILRLPAARFEGWLRTVVRRRLCDLQRRHLDTQRRDPRREVSGETGDTHCDPLAALVARERSVTAQLETSEQAARLGRCLEKLRVEDRHLLQLRYFDDLPLQEVAVRLGVSTETCRKRDYRSRLLLLILLLQLKA